ncbi:MAG: hypothetical protein K8J08_05515 [Thermoanaerobaculia bacterium]|nr:hypothetical protein [Thermoanaerobaculia bacterium]
MRRSHRFVARRTRGLELPRGLWGFGLLLQTLCSPMLAQTITVDALGDSTGGLCSPGACTLREAIENSVPSGVIDFDPALVGTIALDPAIGSLVVDKQLSISGRPDPTLLTVEANGTHRVLRVDPLGSLQLFGLTLTGGNSGSLGSAGGGVLNQGYLELVNMVVVDNVGFAPNWMVAMGAGSSGGGIYNEPGKTLILVDSLLENNRGGRGSSNFINPHLGFAGGHGGALLNAGSVTIERSTLRANQGGPTDSGQGNGGSGGAIFNMPSGEMLIRESLLIDNVSGPDGGAGVAEIDGRGGAIFNQGQLQIINSTLTGNSSRTEPGGAIWVDDQLTATVRLENVTIARNSSTTGADGVHQPGPQGTVVLRNTLLADNGTDCFAAPGSWISEGFNLVGNENGCPGVFIINDLVGTAASPLDPLLGPVGNNGGPTDTLALLAGSPAIDAADIGGCKYRDLVNGVDLDLLIDQRNETRPFDGDNNGTDVCDIGAFELHPVFFLLSTNFVGSGSGTVVSSPAGINCTANCDGTFASGTVVDLASAPDAGSVFLGYGGDCSGSTCSVTMNADHSVDVEFVALRTLDVTVTLVGAASGSVQSSPAGIDCGADCDEDYLDGTTVTLVAMPIAPAILAGWTGDCVGRGACVVDMTAARSVGARFEVAIFVDGFESGNTSGWSSVSP